MAKHRKIFKVCMAILQHYAWKGYTGKYGSGKTRILAYITKCISLQLQFIMKIECIKNI